MRASYNEWKYFHSRSIFCAENEFFVRKSSMKPVYIVKGRMSGPTVNGKPEPMKTKKTKAIKARVNPEGLMGPASCFHKPKKGKGPYARKLKHGDAGDQKTTKSIYPLCCRPI
jgi:hypothetical protein